MTSEVKTFKSRDIMKMWDAIRVIEVLSDMNRPDAIVLKKKFGHALIRNKKKLTEYGEAFDKARQKPKWLAEYEAKNTEINKKYALIDESGEPKIVGNVYVFGENSDVAQKARDELKEVFQERIDAYDAEAKDFEETTMEEDIPFEPFMVDFKYVPDEIGVAQLSALDDIIREPSDDDEG